MGVDDNPEFWFHLYGITALVGLAVNVERISKLAHICDKRAAMCNHWMAFLPSVITLTFGALAYLGLMIPATFIHVDEGDASKDTFYEAVNWISYVVMVLLFMWPHVYAMDYYSAKKWNKYIYRVPRKLQRSLPPVVLERILGAYLHRVVQSLSTLHRCVYDGGHLLGMLFQGRAVQRLDGRMSGSFSNVSGTTTIRDTNPSPHGGG